MYSLTPNLIAAIDYARGHGVPVEHIVDSLGRAGHPQPLELMRQYGNVPDAYGRPRAEVNPGDPLDPLYPGRQ